MPVYRFDQTKPMIAEHIRFGVDTFTAAIMRTSYDFNAAQKSFTSMQTLSYASVEALFTTSYHEGVYRLYLQPLSFYDVVADVSSVVIYANGQKGSVVSPVLFAMVFGEENLSHSDLVFSWSSPLMKW